MTPKIKSLLESAEVSRYMALLFEHHPLTYHHCVRVAGYAEQMYPLLEVNPYDFPEEELLKGALLHDIGKLDVPTSILEKTDLLTAKEWSILRSHPETGYERIKTEFSPIVLNCVRYHHERKDGSGYASQLTTTNIPFEAAILAVLDSYDAMTSDRIYKPALSHEKVMQELYREAVDIKVESRIIDLIGYIHAQRLQ